MEKLFFLRLVVAIIFIYHSMPKLKNAKEMAAGIGWPANRVFALGFIEFISSLGLLGGIAVKLSSVLLITIMVGAIYYKVKKWNIPFMAKNGTGWEFDLVLLAANLTIYLNY